MDPRVVESLRSAHDGQVSRGELLSTDRLQAGYAAFRARFGPDVLKSLDGPGLLHTMHAHGNRESLVYWLEFKNDDEFPGQKFGSIAGGSAHKFGLFRRRETEQWVQGSVNHEKNISEADAVVIARRHRDQLMAGINLLEGVAAAADDAAYLALQGALEEQAPDICGLAWAHKYWSLLFPEKLDDYHNARWQRHHLVRVLEEPPPEDGLYVCAGRFVRLAAELAWPMNHLTSALNERDGNPIRYWRLGTRVGEGPFIWPAMRDGSYAAIGWDALGDLSEVAEGEHVRESVRSLLEQEYPGDARIISRKAGEIRDFIERTQAGDVIVAADGQRVLGVGRVTGPYRYEDTEPSGAPHRRAVEWSSTAEWNLPTSEGLRTTYFQIGRHINNILEIERRLLDGDTTSTPKLGPAAPTPALRLDGIPGRIQAILERKGQAILFGPPGTGKTHWARRTARDLAAIGAFGRRFEELSAGERGEVEGTEQSAGLVRWCTFHPAYGYEDFIEGFRPEQSATGQLVFERRAGIFKTICDLAGRTPDRKFVLVLDEINRGDIPRIFGELLTLLERDKRGLKLNLALSGNSFAVPANVYLIGTMNTADRSIALLDTALRRRFGFVELMPDASALGGASAGGVPLGPWLTALNDRVRTHLGRDARNLQVGHAYLLQDGHPVTDFAQFVRVLAEDLVPLLEEYCYEDYGALARILGPGLVDEAGQRIREELFAAGRRAELVQALLEPAPEIVTTAAAATPEEVEQTPEAEEPEA
ncbi:MAG TPA: AAA family ATPase [Bryobacteraceae bacterium]|nr:AAA family ATPase [Bryobacteraceae bacterium]